MAGKRQEAIHLKGGQLLACCLLLCAAGALCRLAPALATSPPDPLEPAGAMPPKLFDEDYLCLLDEAVKTCFVFMRKYPTEDTFIKGCCSLIAERCKPFIKNYFPRCKGYTCEGEQTTTEEPSLSHARRHHSRRTHFERRTDRFW